MEYTLSQIERFSAFKMQTRVAVNTSSSNWYNFTYEIYDASSVKWVYAIGVIKITLGTITLILICTATLKLLIDSIIHILT